MVTNILLIISVILLSLILTRLTQILAKTEDQDPSGNTLWNIQLLLEKIELSTRFSGASEARYEYDESGKLEARVLHFIGRPSIRESFEDGQLPYITKFSGYQRYFYDSGKIKKNVLYLDGYPLMIKKYDESGNTIYTKDCRDESDDGSFGFEAVESHSNINIQRRV